MVGSRASPTLITAGGGITFGGFAHECQFVAGNAVPVTISADPQITDGTVVGQRVTLIGCSDTDTLTVESARGILSNGTVVLILGGIATYFWDGTDWILEMWNELV